MPGLHQSVIELNEARDNDEVRSALPYSRCKRGIKGEEVVVPCALEEIDIGHTFWT
jgi:hypothetical protein